MAQNTPKAKYKRPEGLKPKDLIGVPWRVALALQADGWYLRSEIIWHKSNPMPESVKDRPTKGHEHVFLLSHPDGGGKYYYDIEAIKEPSITPDTVVRGSGGVLGQLNSGKRGDAVEDYSGTSRNKRDVWTVTLEPYYGAHFACWPQKLVEPMVLAGCPKGGTVLDTFSGSATTGLVALKKGRNYVGIDLNESYLPLARCRISGTKLGRPKSIAPEVSTLDVFGVTSD